MQAFLHALTIGVYAYISLAAVAFVVVFSAITFFVLRLWRTLSK